MVVLGGGRFLMREVPLYGCILIGVAMKASLDWILEQPRCVLLTPITTFVLVYVLYVHFLVHNFTISKAIGGYLGTGGSWGWTSPSVHSFL